MKGTIDQVWENEARNGQKYVTVQIDGERYSVWDQNHFDQLQEGAVIEYGVRKSGKFQHLTDVRVVGDQAQSPYRSNGRETQIARMSCLKSASEIVAPHQADPVAKRMLVVDVARYFERYVFGEDELDFPPDEQGEQNAGNS